MVLNIPFYMKKWKRVCSSLPLYVRYLISKVSSLRVSSKSSFFLSSFCFDIKICDILHARMWLRSPNKIDFNPSWKPTNNDLIQHLLKSFMNNVNPTKSYFVDKNHAWTTINHAKYNTITKFATELFSKSLLKK